MGLFLFAIIILLALSALVGYFYYEKQLKSWIEEGKTIRQETANIKAKFLKESEEYRRVKKQELDDYNSGFITQQEPPVWTRRNTKTKILSDLTDGQKKILQEAEELLRQQEKMLNELQLPSLSAYPNAFSKRKITIKQYDY
jgi:hypothetical protein